MRQRPLTLCAADADAFDALVEASWRLEALPPALQGRAQRALALLRPLDEPLPLDDEERLRRTALVERTLHRVRRAPARNGASTAAAPVELTEEERAAVDALVASGWDPRAARVEIVERASRLADIVELLEALDAPAADKPAADDDLVERTLSLVQQEIDRSERLRRLGAPSPIEAEALLEQPRGSRLGARLWDVVGLAAAAALAASVILPAMTHLRTRSMRSLGAARLAGAAVGFDLYSQDHLGELPALGPEEIAAAGSPGPWWAVGQSPSSHSADLFTLARKGYTSLESLASPGNPHAPVRMDMAGRIDWRRPEEVSFSYQLFPQRSPLRMDELGPSSVVLADRSPVVAWSLQGQASPALAGSPNQRGLGLLLLRADGSSQWRSSPLLEGGDNIWLPATLEPSRKVRLKGVERPATRSDAFVGP